MRQLAPKIGSSGGRLAQWCAAFAAMTALELAEAADSSYEHVELFVALARAGT